MADINAVNFKYITDWEGKLSKNPKDRAAADPVPDGSGYHTNIGVTWSTFKTLAKQAGYVATAALFYKMPKNIWLKIYKIGYWDPMNADNIKSQGIAELLVDWAWGSGPGTAARFVQRYLVKKGYKIKVDGAFGPQSTGALNDAIQNFGAKQVFDDLFTIRLNFLKSLSDWSIFGAGWNSRMNALYAFASKILANPVSPIIIFAVVGVAFYLILSRTDLKPLFGSSNIQSVSTAAMVV